MINYFITKQEPCKKCDGKGVEKYISRVPLKFNERLCSKCLGEGIEVSQVNLRDIFSITIDKKYYDSSTEFTVNLFLDNDIISTDSFSIDECHNHEN